MKFFQKIIFSLVLCISIVLIAPNKYAYAQISSGNPASGGPDINCPEDSTFGCFEVGLPGGEGSTGAGMSIDTFVSDGEPIKKFINVAVIFITGILVIIGVITIVIGGYGYMTAAGNASQVETAKERITAALIGIFIAFISVVILNTINPYLGSKAAEPKLGSPAPGSPGSTNGGGGSQNNGNGSSSNNSTDSGTNGLPDSSDGDISGDGTGDENGNGTANDGGGLPDPNFNLGDYGDSSSWPPTTQDEATFIADSDGQLYTHQDAGDDVIQEADAAHIIERLRIDPATGSKRINIYFKNNSQSFPDFLEAVRNMPNVNQAGIVLHAIP